jgi:hypothetical protein
MAAIILFPPTATATGLAPALKAFQAPAPGARAPGKAGTVRLHWVVITDDGIRRLGMRWTADQGAAPGPIL